VAKGKSKKLVLAACNKLLKQAFAVAKSGLPYCLVLKYGYRLKLIEHKFLLKIRLNHLF